MVDVGKSDSARAQSLNQQSVGDGLSEPGLDLDKDDLELQDVGEDGK